MPSLILRKSENEENVSSNKFYRNCRKYIITGTPIGQPKIKPPSVVVGVESGRTLTCNTDQMDAGNPPSSYTIWTKVFDTLSHMRCYKNDSRLQIRIQSELSVSGSSPYSSYFLEGY